MMWYRMLAIWTAYAVEPLLLQVPRRSFIRLRLMSDFEDLSHENLLSKWVGRIWTGLQNSDAGDPRDPGNCLESKAYCYRPPWNITRPTYFDSGLDEEPPRRYTLQVDTDKLLEIAGPAGRLIVSWTTGGPKRWSIAHNLALSIRRNTPELESIFVFIALDADAVRRAQDSGFNAVLNDGSGDLQDDIWKMRWLIQTTCMSLGLEVLVVDSDIVFLTDPFRHFFFDSDVEAMTDHFFPAEQLWATWLRPAEHINTGFLFVRPSARLLAFLVEFIDAHYHGHEGPTLRDGMDQRVFNKFVMHKMEKSPPEVVSRYENITFSGLDWQGKTRRFTPRATWDVPIGSSDTITLRILDPAYKLKSCDGSGQPPAVVHVNGVDPKMYFLRDRNLWYVDDWDDRFNDSTSFLVYHHPKGLNLSADFEVLIAALEIGAYFRRRVVLPDTMNCANSPAYLIYNLSETMVDEPGCTYDYFAHANGLYEVYSRVKPYAIEAGIAREPRFKELSIQRLRGSVQLREELLTAHAERRAAFASARVLEVDDIILLRDGLRSGSFGLRMNPEHVFSCAFQEPLIGAMACLDEPYVEEFGVEAMCEAQSFVKGCGPVGICCCWPFWGWGEKLQYFTGVKWDLPCNCGVSVCETFSRRLDSGNENCCRHAGSTSLFPVTDPGVFYCETNFSWSGPTGAEDSNTYTSQALVEFAANKRTVQQSFQTCSLDRLLRRGDAFPETTLRECNLQFSSFLLRRSKWRQLRKWLEWVFEQRRSLGNSSRLIASMEGSIVTDNTGFSFGKLAHDTEQLEHIISIGHEELHEAASGFRSLLELFAQLQKGAPVREEVGARFAKVRPFFNRALHLPDLDQFVGEVTEFLPIAADWEGASLAVRTRGVAIIRGALTASAQKLVRRWLLESTVWYQSLQNGEIQKSQLRDGLHGPVGFRLVHELQARLPNLLGKLPLLDITGYRHGQQSSGLPWHCLDGIVVAMFWFGSISDSALEVSGRNSSMSFCKGNRVGPAPALQLDAFTREQTPTPARSLACPEGCLLLWQAANAIRTVHRAKVDIFASRPVELLLLFGNYADAGAKAAGFMPTFEGKADSWGEHYYARDHDHR
ncbi:unnamed protein product [Symbiodinium sp. CCMP2456]|nr:unnamed protein product [Symbiodinium sp. CCMP2456]